MKLKTLNKKTFKEVEENIVKNRTNKPIKKVLKNIFIPVNFSKVVNNLSIESTLNSLPEPIKYIISNGNQPISIKTSGDIVHIVTDTNLIIDVKLSNVDTSNVQCKIFDKNNKTYLINTYR